MIGPQAALAEGYESTITVNVISTFLMALLLLPTLKRTATKFNVQPKLVIVSSDAHFMARPIPFQNCPSLIAITYLLTYTLGEFQGTDGTKNIRGLQVNHSGT